MMKVKRDLFANVMTAHSDLKDKVHSAIFTTGKILRVIHPVTDVRLDPGQKGLDRQILYGHPVCQLENTHGLSRDETTGYVGYIHPYSLGRAPDPTHRVSARTTFLFTEPDIKSANPTALSSGSLLTITRKASNFAQTHNGLYAISDHLNAIETCEPDLAKTAEALLGTPYLWGGNASFGIDCSGLIQMAAQAAALDCPGDSDQQMAQLGVTLPSDSEPKRNDLFFWKGHVALVFDETTLIHANAHHMAVAFEPIKDALHRIASQGDTLLAHKRIEASTL